MIKLEQFFKTFVNLFFRYIFTFIGVLSLFVTVDIKRNANLLDLRNFSYFLKNTGKNTMFSFLSRFVRSITTIELQIGV